MKRAALVLAAVLWLSCVGVGLVFINKAYHTTPTLSEISYAKHPVELKVFERLPKEIPFDPANKLHVFCNARHGHVIYVMGDTLAVVKEACK